MSSQKDDVLFALRAKGSLGVCGTVFLEHKIPRYSARIADLRADGNEITTTRCNQTHHNHRTKQFLFSLIPPGQDSLF